MRVAVLHDYLNQYGGAERVLEAILEFFPDADVYTLLYHRGKTLGRFEHYRIKTSVLDIPPVQKHHRLFIPLMPLAAELLKLERNYDLIVSSSAGYAKGFGGGGNAFHICYCHAPLRYAWESEYLKGLPFAPTALAHRVGKFIARRLREWDKRAAGKVNVFIANSSFIREKIRAYYGRDAEVIHPPVDTGIFHPALPAEASAKEGDYYLMVGRLLYYKLFGLGIEACKRLNVPLKIVGSGPEERALRRQANGARNITFVKGASDDELRVLYSGAKAFLFPQTEDFGLVAAEALSCGAPVIAYGEGGSRDIVEEGKTGLFFPYQTVESLMGAMRRSENIRFDRNHIALRAERFSKEEFKRKFGDILKETGFETCTFRRET